MKRRAMIKMGVGAFAALAMSVGFVTRVWAQDLSVKGARAIVSATDPADVRVVATFSNSGMYGSYLVSATSDAAERVELRDARKRDAVVKEVEVPAYGQLTLEPKGLYLRLVNPKRPLKAGARVTVVVTNDAMARITVAAVVAGS